MEPVEQYRNPEPKLKGSIADVHCTGCGAPARFDIKKQKYTCSYCGEHVEISEALNEKIGFRKLQQTKIRDSAKNYRLMHATCSGCGADLIFEEGEAMANCAFCGRTLARREYLSDRELPEAIIPFRITLKEAKEELLGWCDANRRRPESRHVREKVDDLAGFYLPYELVRGPVTSHMSRKDSFAIYEGHGFIDNVFVNCSRQLDNLVLDGAEPYELEELVPFDFSYAAGQKIKTLDIDDRMLEMRVGSEVSNDYLPAVQKVLGTKAVDIVTTAGDALRMPVLLPVYYISSGDTVVAVNGQTGKVSVLEEKVRHFYFTPWWLKAIIATIVSCGVLFGALTLGGLDFGTRLTAVGCLGLILLIVLMAAYSDATHTKFRMERRREILTSDGRVLRRAKGGKLERDAKAKAKTVVYPQFYQTIDGKDERVELVFASPARLIKTALLLFGGVFLPVILAFIINGFNFAKLNFGGSAAWFCLAVPLAPVFIVLMLIHLYDDPWIYILDDRGHKKRYRQKDSEIKVSEIFGMIKEGLFHPPLCFLVWFCILCFCAMVWATAFGWDAFE